MFTEYIELIARANGAVELDRIIEKMAEDESLTNEQYCTLYELAIKSV